MIGGLRPASRSSLLADCVTVPLSPYSLVSSVSRNRVRSRYFPFFPLYSLFFFFFFSFFFTQIFLFSFSAPILSAIRLLRFRVFFFLILPFLYLHVTKIEKDKLYQGKNGKYL